jgi:ferric iron reductase protein FhuF
LPCKLWLPYSAAGPAVEDASTRYRSFCVEHLAPFIEALAAAVHIAPRVLWSNAGNLFEYVMSLFMQMPQYADTARKDSAFLFDQRTFFDTGESNPLRTPIRYVAAPSPRLEDPFRARRVCCLRNQLPHEPLCTSCPLLLTMSKTELETYLNREEENS